MTGEQGGVGVVGLGLIGGGVALDLLRGGHELVGFDVDPDVRARARELDIDVVEDLSTLVSRCELAVVAVPLEEVPGVLSAVRGQRPDLLVTDVASVKDLEVLGAGGLDHFVGGHPMAGNERSGIDAARPGLFDGAVWYVTPRPDTLVGDLVAVLELVRTLAGEPVPVDVPTHDRYVALLSHVPHLLAYGLHASASEIMGEGVHGLGGGSFRDVTRVAASDPGFWADVLHANRQAVREALTLVDAWLSGRADDLEDPDELEHQLAAGRRLPHARPRDAEVEVVLPGPAERLGLGSVEELCRLGASGISVVGLDVSTEAVTVRLAPL
ncbi:MAG: prephenate dehydrogenase/arogenate dehydrogenase family protein [Nitriliruptorales bacterium]|nr:prephenate dehydrogenase/arogenate dehydrogenase family protein [Nitriliruptorales bacterium]